MIGQIIQWIALGIKQTFCLHDYKYVDTWRCNYSAPSFYQCKKCGYIKK